MINDEQSIKAEIQRLHDKANWLRQYANSCDDRAGHLIAAGHPAQRVQRVRDGATMRRCLADDCEGYARALMRKLERQP